MASSFQFPLIISPRDLLQNIPSKESGGTRRQFSENICSEVGEDDLRARIFGTFVAKISRLPASPMIFEHLKNGMIAHF